MRRMDFLHKAFGGGGHTAPHEQLGVLEQRYRPALKLAERQGVRIESLRMVGEKLAIEATAPTPAARTLFLAALDLLDPNRSDVAVKIAIAGTRQQDERARTRREAQ